jgi:hypothetical protein
MRKNPLEAVHVGSAPCADLVVRRRTGRPPRSSSTSVRWTRGDPGDPQRFGRRMDENGNRGLDHGYDNVMLLLGAD